MSGAALLAVLAIAGFVCAMIQNFRIISKIDDERKDGFRRGYYNGFLDAKLGRKNDWRIRHREEEDREREGL